MIKIGETAPLDLWETRPLDQNSWYLNPSCPALEVTDEGTSVDQPKNGSETSALENVCVVCELLAILLGVEGPEFKTRETFNFCTS